MRDMEHREESIRLYMEEHLSYRAIAVKLDIPRETVKSWVRRYRIAKGLIVNPNGIQGKQKPKTSKTEKDYEKRIKQLEMEVGLLRDFLSAEERRSIKK